MLEEYEWVDLEAKIGAMSREELYRANAILSKAWGIERQNGFKRVSCLKKRLYVTEEEARVILRSSPNLRKEVAPYISL